MQRVGGDGWFWWKREEWGREIGVSPRTMSTIIAELEAVEHDGVGPGLITREEYRRPPGGPHGGKNGAPNYRLDPALLGRRERVRLERAS